MSRSAANVDLRRARGEDTRAQILDAARGVLAEDGPFRRLAQDLRGPVPGSELARNL